MKKVCFLLLAAVLLCAIGCKKESKGGQEPILWSCFTYPNYNAHLYLKLENDKAEAICCGSANKIVGRIYLTHDCTEEQFETIKKKLIEHGAIEEESVEKPVIDGYPDLTAYLPQFLPKDKQEKIWKQLVEE